MSLLNKAEVKRMILARVESDRPGWECTRVSSKAINELEARVVGIIIRAIHGHPTIGKTFTGF